MAVLQTINFFFFLQKIKYLDEKLYKLLHQQLLLAKLG